MEGQMEGTNEQLAYTSVAGGIAFEAAKMGAQIGIWNNAYRLGKVYSFGKTKEGFKQRTSVEMLERFASGEKVAGNLKIPFTGLPSGLKIKGKSVGHHVNRIVNGVDYASRGGFGFWKGEGGLLGSGKGIGLNIGFNKEMISDMEHGLLDPAKLKDEISKLGKEKYVSNSELHSILNKSMSERGIIRESLKHNSVSQSISKETMDAVANDITKTLIKRNAAEGEKLIHSEVKELVKDSLFKNSEGKITTSFTSKGVEKLSKSLGGKGAEIAFHDVEKAVYNAGRKKAANFIARKSAKYGIVAGMEAAAGASALTGVGLVPGGALAIAGAAVAAGFATYDIVTTALFANEVSNGWIQSVAEENNSRVNPNLNPGARLNQNPASQSAAMSGFQSIRAGSFGLSQLARKQNIASSYVDKMFGGTI